MPYKRLLLHKRTRYPVLDSARGITMLSMLAYHACWDLVYLFGVDFPWYYSDGAHAWQQSICWTFILLSGFCFSLGRHKLKRSVTILLGSWLITLVTINFMPSGLIWFGVLSLLGSSMLFLTALEPWFRRIDPIAGFVTMLVTFLFVRGLMSGALEGLSVPQAWHADLFTAYLGFPPDTFVSSDYFPIFPWVFLYFTGYFAYRIFERFGWMRIWRRPRVKPLEWIGRHSFEIYLVHQPVIYALCYLICT